MSQSSIILENGGILDESDCEKSRTPSGITEQEMIARLNYLDAEGLQAMPLIGPVIARQILDWRSKNHYFSSLDELIRVPGIGPKKFKTLTGRENLILHFPLHDLLRIHRSRHIYLTDLQPMQRPAPGIERIHLDRLGSERAHKRAARQKGFSILLRKALKMQLIFYLNGAAVEGRAKLLPERLPVLLRRIFKHETCEIV